ncbi:MAG: type I glyceraldehyde-3-phosphate dehydrogenase [Bacteroidota bacterium]
MKKVAINGMGRIGRAALKVIMDTPELEIVAVNDIVPADSIAYLLNYDTVYGRYEHRVEAGDGVLNVGDHNVKFYNERNPADLPWAELGIDVVIESTGIFTNREDAEKHIHAGAKTVVISGPTKSKDTPTVVHGVNTADGKTNIFSCASCTTNNISPVVEVLNRRVGIDKAIMTTIHAYTATQSIVDLPAKDPRKGRAAAQNMIPTSTGAAIATTKALPEMTGKFDGVAVRVPTPVGSISDMTFVTSRDVTAEEIIQILTEESESPRYRGVLGVTTDPIVSSDIIQDPRASVVDLGMVRVVDGNLLKVMTWYDNEWGFTNQMIRQILEEA